jgi:protein-S-isoprenylcysteine O-methyltransferase Ste14
MIVQVLKGFHWELPIRHWTLTIEEAGPFVPYTPAGGISRVMVVMAHNHAATDNPAVVVRPPLLYGVALIAMLTLRWFWPMPIAGRALTLWPGLALLALGLAILIPGRRALRTAGTNVNPSRPTTAIVTSGPYRFTRNPLYVGVTLVYSGLTLAIDTWWGFVLLAPVFCILHLGVVLREERYLEQKFGDTYREYRSRVRRYL